MITYDLTKLGWDESTEMFDKILVRKGGLTLQAALKFADELPENELHFWHVVAYLHSKGREAESIGGTNGEEFIIDRNVISY